MEKSSIAIGALVLALTAGGLRAAGQKFYDDDPIAREPETQDASRVRSWDNVLTFDLLQNLFANPGDAEPVHARNVNTVDEVPDSSWFTNRILARNMTVDEIVRGPITAPGPAPGVMTITRAKPSGVSPGFVLRDSTGVTWFVQFDAPDYPEAASAASMVANRIFYALGYWQAENYIAQIRPESLVIGNGAVTETPSGKIRKLDWDDLKKVFERAARQPDGAYRMLASRAIPGRSLRGFRYFGTRPDDPNDIVPHEHRRELRALKVFGAWTNLVDMKAGNTLDTVITENGRSVVRHYLQDVGSTFGTGALGPRDWDEGHEYLFESAPMWKRLASGGFYVRPWQTVRYDEYSSIGRFEGEEFDPEAWKPRVPTAAFRNARADDNFWAARRVVAFSNELIRAVAAVGRFSSKDAENHLAEVLIKRRDRIGRAYLVPINPVVNVALDGAGTLTFDNAAVDAAAAAPPASYAAEWFAFENTTSESRPLGKTTAANGRMNPPAALPAQRSAFVRIDIAAIGGAHPAWSVPVQAYFKRADNGWTRIALERQSQQ
jgi:hypothetical protein